MNEAIIFQISMLEMDLQNTVILCESQRIHAKPKFVSVLIF